MLLTQSERLMPVINRDGFALNENKENVHTTYNMHV